MIIEYDNKYKDGYTRLLKLLWNDIDDDNIDQLITSHNMNKEKCFLYLLDDNPIGFINLSIRNDYVEGSSSNGVGYIEGIYVCEPHRRNQIAYKLVTYAVSFFKSMGLTEIASDTEIENDMSQIFHKAIGFKEVSVIKHYIMKIGD